jgi:hypothetical protein
MNFRDYPQPYMLARQTQIWGVLAGSEAFHGGHTVRHTTVAAATNICRRSGG